MSRYLAFVFLALSATSVLAAPAELPAIPAIPDTTTITQPVVGPRSNGKVYSPNTLRKRDWQYPTSTNDCRLSEVPEDSTTLSYTHDGQEYSEECLTRLALSVPFENRESCRATGADARGYDEECLFKKAFDEDWKFDVEKAKEDELAWRAANPSASSSDAWRRQFPTAISDCIVVDIDVRISEKREVVGKNEEKVVKGGKKGTTKSSDAMSGWSPYSVAPTGETLENDCLVRLLINAEIDLDLGTCTVEEAPRRAADTRVPLFGRPTTELAAPQDTLAVAISIIAALRLGCLLEIVARIIVALGIEVRIAGDPILGLAAGILALLSELL